MLLHQKLLLLSMLLIRYKRSKSKQNQKSCLIIKSNLNKRGEDKGYDVVASGHKRENGEKGYRAERRGKGKRRECGYRLQYVLLTWKKLLIECQEK